MSNSSIFVAVLGSYLFHSTQQWTKKITLVFGAAEIYNILPIPWTLSFVFLKLHPQPFLKGKLGVLRNKQVIGNTREKTIT